MTARRVSVVERTFSPTVTTSSRDRPPVKHINGLFIKDMMNLSRSLSDKVKFKSISTTCRHGSVSWKGVLLQLFRFVAPDTTTPDNCR